MEQDLRQFAILMSVERAQIHVLFTTTAAPLGENFPYVLRFAEFLAIAIAPILASLLAFELLFQIGLEFSPWSSAPGLSGLFPT